MKCLTVYQCMDLHFLALVLVRGDILIAVVCVAWGVILFVVLCVVWGVILFVVLCVVWGVILFVVLCVVWGVILFVVRCVDLLMVGLDVGILVLLTVVGGIGGVGNPVVA